MSEFFGSVWQTLTTENLLITKLITSPCISLEIWLGFLLFTYILKIHYTKKQELLHILVLSISSIITVFFIPTPLNVLLNYIIMFIFIKTNLKLNIIKTILSIIIPSVLFALIGILILKPILLIFNITVQRAQCTPIFDILYLIILYISLFLIIKLIKNNNLRLILIENFNSKNRKLIVLNLAMGFISLGTQLTITSFYTDLLPMWITILSFISLLAYFSISFFSLTRTMKLQITAKNLESAENYNNTLSYLYDNVRAFHHDFDNMLFIIGGFIDNNDIVGLKKYYKNLEKDGERVNELALLNPKTINNSGIYNLLMSKYKKAHIANVEIKLDYFFDFERLKMPIYEFSRILGILLDNAIEAASESKEKQVKICFRDSSANNTQIISVENTYANKDIDTSIIFEKGKTSKENHTGMGLWEVKQILRKHNNTVLKTTNDENYFKQTLEIYY